MYRALYRKYRPRTFEDVVGQEHITVTLKNEIAMGRVSHAYLFTGSRGTGKTTCSKIIAKAVNCPNQKDGNPCCECEICRGIDDGSILDVAEIDAASNNGVDHIRQLREEAFFTPGVARYRVYIIDEAHMLSAGAFNALLKILEEPPAHVIFILATTELHKVPPTILSRCQRFDFRRIASDVIAARLLQIAQTEGISLEPEAAALIARLSDGGMRDALSLLDLCASRGGEITGQVVVSAAGVAVGDHLFAIADGVLEQDAGAVLGVVDEMARQGADYAIVCSQLVSHYRNLMVCKTLAQPGELIACLPEELPRYRQQAARYQIGAVLHALRMLQDALSAISRAANRRAELEMALVRLCSPALDSGPEALLRRVEALEAALRAPAGQPVMPPPQPVASSPAEQSVRDTGGAFPGGSAGEQPEAPKPQPPKAARPDTGTPDEPAAGAAPKAGTSPEHGISAPPQEQAHAQPAASQPAAPQPFERWPEVLERLEQKNRPLHGALRSSQAYLQGGRVLIDSQNEFFLKLVRENAKAKNDLKECIAQVAGAAYAIGPYRRTEPEASADPLEEMLREMDRLGVPVELQ